MTERRRGERRLSDKGTASQRDWHLRLHRLWTWAVGKEGYSKKEWQDFADRLGRDLGWQSRER